MSELKKQKKLRIAMVCDPITDYIAGVFVSTLRLSERLHERGHHVIFLAAKSPHSQGVNDYKTMPIFRFRSILLPKTENRFRLAFPTVAEVRRILEKERIEIVHVLLPTPMAFITIKAARSLGLKVVIHSHAQPENTTANLPWYLGKRPINFLLGKYFSWLYRKSDFLIYPSEFARSLFSRHNHRIPNAVISNGIDTAVFQKTGSEELFIKWKLPRQTSNILFVGRLHPEKNIEVLIKSMPYILSENDNVHLYIVGPGHQKDELRALVSELNIGRHVTFFGKVSEKELIMAYSACNIFVLPSLAELEGMVVLEAMACGKPIIVSDSADSASRFFVDQNGFLFEARNPADLAKKALILLNDPELRRKMGQRSLELSKLKDINESVSKLEAVYDMLKQKDTL